MSDANATTATTASTLDKHQIEKMADTIARLRAGVDGAPDQRWVLIAPDGRVWAGVDPLVMAAQAKGADFFPSWPAMPYSSEPEVEYRNPFPLGRKW